MMTAKGARLAVQNVEPRTPNGCKTWMKIAGEIERAILRDDSCKIISFKIPFLYTTNGVHEYVEPDDSEIHRVVQALKVYGYDVVRVRTETGVMLNISWKADESSIGYLKRQYEYYGNKLREKGVLR